MISVFVFLICKYKHYENFSTFLFTFITLAIGSVITYFLSKILVGRFVCNNKESKCISNYYKDNSFVIPEEFCDESYKFECECISNEDCGGGINCICSSGTCQPKIGERKIETVNKYKIRYVLIISSVIISIFLPLLFI